MKCERSVNKRLDDRISAARAFIIPYESCPSALHFLASVIIGPEYFTACVVLKRQLI